MKLAKAIKKLKFWSRKKKRHNKYYYNIEEYAPPPPPNFHHCHSWVPVQPSAPPLPSWWFDHEQTQFGPDSGIAASSSSTTQAEFIGTHKEEIAPDLNSVLYPPPPPASEVIGNTTSYQQCMVPNPVYGVPVLPAVRRERDGGFFGHLIRCFFPCFHIKEN